MDKDEYRSEVRDGMRISAQETRDYYDCIEWAGTQEWSNGKVGLLGISYYAVNQWQVAALRGRPRRDEPDDRRDPARAGRRRRGPPPIRRGPYPR